MTSMDVPRRSAWNPKSLALLALLKGGGSKVTRRPRESAIDALRQTTFSVSPGLLDAAIERIGNESVVFVKVPGFFR